MEWTPITEAALWELIIAAEGRMAPHILRLWETIRIAPVRWNEARYGTDGNGFWVVAIVGSSVIWYNDIEDGFNFSGYAVMGNIAEYCCNQDELELAVQHVSDLMNAGRDATVRGSPRLAGSFSSQ